MISLKSQSLSEFKSSSKMELRSHRLKKCVMKKSESSPHAAFATLENLKLSLTHNSKDDASSTLARKSAKFITKYEEGLCDKMGPAAFTCSQIFASLEADQDMYQAQERSIDSLIQSIDEIKQRVQIESDHIDSCLNQLGNGNLNTRQLVSFYKRASSLSTSLDYLLLQMDDDIATNLSKSLQKASQTNSAVIELTKVLKDNHIYANTLSLINAIRNGQESTVEEILETKEIDPSCIDKYGKSTLDYAIEKDKERFLSILLSSDKISSEFLNTPDKSGYTPFYNMCVNGSICSVMVLLESSKCTADCLTWKSPDGLSPILELASRGIFNINSFLLESEKVTPEMLNIQDGDKNTVLMHMTIQYAAFRSFEKEHLAILASEKVTEESLLMTNENGNSVLVSIAKNSSEATKKALLTSEKISSKSLASLSEQGIAIIHYICGTRSADILKLIISSEKVTTDLLRLKTRRGEETPITLMARYCSSENLQRILESEKVTTEALMESNSSGVSLITEIVHLGHSSLISKMLSSEKVTTKCLVTTDISGKTPLHVIASHRNQEVRLSLLNHEKISAELLNLQDSRGSSVLMNIARDCSVKTCEAIIDCPKITEESLFKQNLMGYTPIFFLTQNLEVKSLQALLSSDLITRRVLCTEINGSTAALEIAKSIKPEVVVEFLKSEKIPIEEHQGIAPYIPNLLSSIISRRSNIINLEVIKSDRVPARLLTDTSSSRRCHLLTIVSCGGVEVRRAILESDKFTSDDLALRGHSHNSCLDHMCSHPELHEAILSSDKVTAEVLTDQRFRAVPLSVMAYHANSSTAVAIINSDKVSCEALVDQLDSHTSVLESLLALRSDEVSEAIIKSEKLPTSTLSGLSFGNTPLPYYIARSAPKSTISLMASLRPELESEITRESESRRDLVTPLKFEYISDAISAEKIKEDLDKSIATANDLMFKMIISFSKKAMLISAMEHPETLINFTSFDPIISLASGSYDILPTPENIDSIDIRALETIGSQILSETPQFDISFIQNMINRTRNRTPYIGLPNHTNRPAEFEEAYAHIEKALKIMTIIAQELHEKLEKASIESERKDFQERLDSFYSRLSGIGEACGTRYSQDLPMLYHEQALSDDLECIQAWKSQTVAIPEDSDPRIAIRSHLSPILSKHKVDLLKQIYTMTARTQNAHEVSAFWKTVSEEFHLNEDIDPLASTYHLDSSQIRSLFSGRLQSKEIISLLQSTIKSDGADNPYSSVIGELATQCGFDSTETLMKAWNVDEETYEFRQMTEGFVTLCLMEAKVTSIGYYALGAVIVD